MDLGEQVGFGIDIGGTGMKAAPVDLLTGELVGDRYRIDTPQPATPAAMAEVVSELVAHFDWKGPLGVAFPAVVRNGVVHSAANISDEWIGVDAAEVFGTASGRGVYVLNDADAAGVAEMRFGAGRGRDGVVIVLTFGTGIGSGFFVNGHLAANSELGHLEVDGVDAELRAAASARGRDGLSWEDWAGRVQRYLTEVVKLFSPELIVVGGGASKKPDKWLPHIDVGVEIAVASMANSAGIVGAALMAPALTAE
jgi:polyphosphate glucokinase